MCWVGKLDKTNQVDKLQLLLPLFNRDLLSLGHLFGRLNELLYGSPGLNKWGKWTITCTGMGQGSCEGQGPHLFFAQVCHSGGWVCIRVEYTTGFNKRLMCGREQQGEGGDICPPFNFREESQWLDCRVDRKVPV